MPSALRIDARLAIASVMNDPAHSELMDLDQVQATLHRSRASIYRYVNTDNQILNSPFDPQRLNPEIRHSRRQPLLFHPSEVARFAKDVLRYKTVNIEFKDISPNQTQQLLESILDELQAIRQLLESQSSS